MFRKIFFCLLVISKIASAQEESKKLRVDPRRPLRIDYTAPSWNKAADKIDSAALIIRDSISGRLVKVEVNESGENSSQFTGTYHINFDQTGAASEISPEIYVVPMGMLKSEQALKRVQTLIDEGILLRKPFFLRTEKGFQLISVFDSKSQALDAYNSFVKNTSGKPLIDPSILEAQRLAEKAAAEKALALKAALEEENRRKLEEQERLRRDELIKKQAELDAAEVARRKKLAMDTAQQALALYKSERYKEAEAKFNQAIEMDPQNKTYFFQYGVTLYRNEKYNRAIVALNTASGENTTSTERDYYLGLSYMKLKDYESSYRMFEGLKGKNDPTLSASSAFFCGVIDFQKESYDKAKAHFEYVLDKSSDPKMDEQAESYIEQIANIKMFEEMRKKKFIITGNFGLMYDSNILAVNAANAPTDLAGYRWTYGGSFEYRPIFSEHHEFSAILSISDMYSTDKGFAAKTEFQNTDPLSMTLSFPYKWKGTLLEKPAQVGLTPSYETVNLNADASGARELIVASTVLKTDATLVMKEDHFANYSLEFRSDSSKISASGDDDQSATKITLSTTQTLFQDRKKTKAWIIDGSLAQNNALGNNQKYNRIDLAGSYLMPGVWESSFITRLGFGSANYGSHTTGRSDTSPSLTFVLQKPITETWSAMASLAFNRNTSTIESSSYDKTTLTVSGTWKDAF